MVWAGRARSLFSNYCSLKTSEKSYGLIFLERSETLNFTNINISKKRARAPIIHLKLKFSYFQNQNLATLIEFSKGTKYGTIYQYIIESFFLYTLYTMYTMYTSYTMYIRVCTMYILYTQYTIHDVYIVYITWLYTKYILYMMYTIYTIYTYLLKNDIYLHDQIFVLHFGIHCIQYIHITHFIHIYYQDEIIEGMIADWISNLFSVRKLDINWNVTVNEMEFKMSFLMSKVHFFCNYPYIL